jgi:hypothetical protein
MDFDRDRSIDRATQNAGSRGKKLVTTVAVLSGFVIVAGALATAVTPAMAQYYCPPGYYYAAGYGCVANPPPGYAYPPAPPPVVTYPAPPLFGFGLSFGFGGGRGWHGGGHPGGGHPGPGGGHRP